MSRVSVCRICDGIVHEFFDFGNGPLANGFVLPGEADGYRFHLAIGACQSCDMVQLLDLAPHEQMFHRGYPYRSSESATMRAHFGEIAQGLLDNELTGADPFVVELGSNDGIMLRSIAERGIRHLGIEPCGDVAEIGRANGIRVLSEFFDEDLGAEILAEDGPADVVFGANTVSHISFIDSVFRGVDKLLAPEGVFIFEDPYFGDIIHKTSFDQIYDEHIFFFTATSVQTMARRYGFELVDVFLPPVHGGEIRCTVARPGRRPVSSAVGRLLAEEQSRKLTEPGTLQGFGDSVNRVRDDLVRLLSELKAERKRVVGYGATAKSTTMLNYCGIGPDLVEFICDSTPSKQGRLTPGMHIPVREPAAFKDPYPDYALLLAWNHGDEVMRKEADFHSSGGRWIQYVPDVRVV